MSYILEALKKSERERSLGVVEKLRTPARAPVFRWGYALVLGALSLLLVVFVIGMTWLYRDPLRALFDSAPQVGEVDPPAAAKGVPNGPLSTVIDSTREIEVPPAAPEAAPASARGGEDPTESVAGEVGGGEAGAAPVDLAALPEAVRSRLPPLKISVLSYSADAPRRFAMIDGQIHREGDHLPEGIRVERILRDRVVLSLLSEQFQIFP